MSVSKDEKRGTWLVQCWYRDWQGERHKKTKRGFATKREAQAWERDFLARCSGSLAMTFGEFVKLYEQDVRPRLKLNTWLTKEHIIETKILPYFADKRMDEVSSTDVFRWENAMTEARTTTGEPYSQTYLRTVSNQLSAILNHAVRFYGLPVNPMAKVGKIGSKRGDEMRIWTKEEYLRFSEAMMDKPVSFAAFETLYWTGVRVGELLALLPTDFDFPNRRLRVTKSYQRIRGEDVVTCPKTPKSVRTIDLPIFLCEELREYVELEKVGESDRMFPVSKGYLHHEMDRGCKETGVGRIRIHDLRHSHVSLLIDLGFSALSIAERMGHESIDITYRYAHLFPNRREEMAERLDEEGRMCR